MAGITPALHMGSSRTRIPYNLRTNQNLGVLNFKKRRSTAHLGNITKTVWGVNVKVKGTTKNLFFQTQIHLKNQTGALATFPNGSAKTQIPEL